MGPLEPSASVTCSHGAARIFRYAFDTDWLYRPYRMFLWAAAVLAWFWVAYLGLFQEYLFLCVCSRKIPYFSGQLQAIQKGMVTSICSVTSDPLCLKPSGFEGMVEKVLGQSGFL